MSSASAKIILFGEHAVVYNHPAIAIPIADLRAYAEVTDTHSHFQIIAHDLNNKIITFDGDDPLLQVVRLTLDKFEIEIPNIIIEVRSDIPIASGLGSGAAISTAIVRALLEYLGLSCSDELINEIVFESEKVHHGTPSGIDNTVIVYERAVYFVRSQPIEQIHVATPLRVLVADTGKTALTKIAVGDVARLYEDHPESTKLVIEEISEIAKEARNALEQGRITLLGDLMVRNHALLKQLTVSSDELDRLVKSAMNAGALGAKLSGGGRGGNMIALVTEGTEATVTQALLDAGAVRVFGTTLEAT